MKEFTLSKNQSGYQLRQVLHKILSEAPTSFIYKMLRKKNITMNGKKAEGTEVTKEGDVIRFFLSDETFFKFSKPLSEAGSQKKEEASHTPRKNASAFTGFSVVYQDEDVLIFVKPQGILSQKAGTQDLSANDFVLAYAQERGLYSEDDPVFRPSIVNRLDRNTEGLMVAGLSLKGLRILNEMFKERTVAKYYCTIVAGKATEALHDIAYLKKDEAKNTVNVYRLPAKDTEKIETSFERVFYDEKRNLSLLKVHLITGKSHQIRAHLSSLGFPVLGDEKYGKRDLNRAFSIREQCLQSYEITFPECDLPHISGKTFSIPFPTHWPIEEKL